MPCARSTRSVRSHISSARAVDELVGQVDVRLAPPRRRPPPGGTRPRSCAPARARACGGCRRAARRACRTRSPRRLKSSSSSGSCFSFTSLTCTSNTASRPFSSSAGYSSGKSTSTVRCLAGARADQLLLEALDQPPAADLEHVVARLAALERLAVHAADEVHHQVVALLRLPVDAVQPREGVAQPVELCLRRPRSGTSRGALADLELAGTCRASPSASRPPRSRS